MTVFSASKKGSKGDPLSNKSGSRSGVRPRLKFAAQTDFWGHSCVGVTEIEGGEKYSEEGKELVDNCENLYQDIKVARK